MRPGRGVHFGNLRVHGFDGRDGLILVDRPDALLNGRDEVEDIVVCADDNVSAGGLAHLIQWRVDQRLGRGARTDFPHIADNSDDFTPHRMAGFLPHGKALANHIERGKISARQRLIDDNDEGLPFCVGVAEVPAGEKWNAEGAKKIRRDAVCQRGLLARFWIICRRIGRGRVSLGRLSLEGRFRDLVRQGKDQAGGGRGYSGNGARFLQYLLNETDGLLRARKAELREVGFKGYQMIGAETQVQTQQPLETAHGEGCTNQQNHREGYFANDQEVTQEIVTGTGTAPAGAAFLDRRAEVLTGAQQGRGQPRKQSGEKRSRQREPNYRAIDANFLKARDSRRKNRAQTLDCPSGNEKSAGAARERQQQTFHGELAQQSAARGANRGANGKLAAASPTAGEKEVADVGAGNQQHKTHGTKQNGQRSAGVAQQILFQRIGMDAPAFVDIRILGRKARGDGSEFALRLLHPDVRLDARDQGIGMVVTRRQLLFTGNKWRPHGGIGREVKRGHRGHHANDRMRLAVEHDGFADGRGIAAKPFVPQRSAENCHPDARSHIGGDKSPAVQRPHAEKRKEIFGDRGAFDSSGHSAAGEFLRRVLVGGDRGKHGSTGAEIRDVREGQAEIEKVEKRAARGNVHEFGRVRKRQRAKQDGVDHTKNRGVCADAEGQR